MTLASIVRPSTTGGDGGASLIKRKNRKGRAQGKSKKHNLAKKPSHTGTAQVPALLYESQRRRVSLSARVWDIQRSSNGMGRYSTHPKFAQYVRPPKNKYPLRTRSQETSGSCGRGGHEASVSVDQPSVRAAQFIHGTAVKP